MKQKIILLFTTLLLCLFVSEVVLLFLIEKDLDNNKLLNNLHLKPFQLPVIETKVKIDKFLSSNYNNNYQNVRLVPDSILGWSPNPNYGKDDKLYKYNIDGIRVNEISKTFCDTKTLRIAIFGDSYIHGDEVNFNETIGKQLQDIFQKDNINIKVLNFAVSGYGMDQAFLRYKEVNNKFIPDIILLGVQFENVKRHANILRPFYSHQTEIPYSKPRFIINNSELQLIPNPILDISKTVEIIKNFENWPFSKYESFYVKSDYRSHILYYSRTFQVTSSLISTLNSEFEFYSPTNESYRITKKIFMQFVENCNLNDQLLIPVHLPTINDLEFLQRSFFGMVYSQKFIYQELYLELKKNTQFVETFDKLNSWASENSLEELFMNRHYSPIANKIIAEQIYNYLVMNYSELIKN